MAPKGRNATKTKEAVEENGKSKRVRGARNVKAASYKDLSDSDEDKKRKPDSESESEEEKPKKRTAGRKKAQTKRKAASESEDESDYRSSDEFDEDPKPSKRSKPQRHLRAARNASYKDLSDSEEEILDEVDQSESEEEKPKKKAGSPRKAVKKKVAAPRSEEEDEEDDYAEEEEEDEESDVAVDKSKKEVSPSKKTPKEASESEDEKESKPVASGKTPSDKQAPSPTRDEDDQNMSGSEEKSEDGSAGIGKKSSSKPDHDLSDEDCSEEEKIPKKRGRPQKSSGELKDDNDKPPPKKAKIEEKAKTEEKPRVNKTDSDFSTMDLSSDKKTKDGKLWNFKISSWNVAGLKAWVKKNGLDFIKHEQPDILCLQETKCSEQKLPPECKVKGYHSYWCSGEKEGYAGVALLSKEKPIKVDFGIGKDDFDKEGRLITAEYEKFFLVNVYVPNAGHGLKTLPRRMEWDPLLRAHLKSLDEKKPVILCGDMNVAHQEIDLANPKTNTKNAGFTPEERAGMSALLKEGFVDTFRHLNPDKTGAYTFWTYIGNARSRNTGWRLDYFIFSERLMPALCDNVMRSDVYGSDHCPITLFVHI